jgi:hypothetical protein
MYNVELNLIERKKEYLYIKKEENKTLYNDYNKSIIKIKLKICNEEEIGLKRLLNKLNENENMQLKENQLKSLLNESTNDPNNNLISEYKIEEIKEIISKIDLNSLKTLDFENYEVCDDEDDYDDSNFFDAYDDPLTLLQEEAKEKQRKNNEINSIKKKITEIGAKKSALRISMVFLL